MRQRSHVPSTSFLGSRPLTRRAFLASLLASLGGAAGAALLPSGAFAGAARSEAPPRRARLALPDPGGPVLVLAPHPDDEVLGAGARWHTLLRQGHEVRVVVVTSGDGFFVDAERVFETLRPNAKTYRALGERRMAESEEACAVLGLPARRLAFLGFPDGGTASLFLEDWDRLYHDPHTATDHDPYRQTLFPGIAYRGRDEFAALKRVLAETEPRTLILPHPYDHHPDHWATHAFAVAALEALRQEGRPFAARAVSFLYLVHWPGWPVPAAYVPDAPLLPPAALGTAPTSWYAWPLRPELEALKRRALLAYKTQMLVMADRLLAFVRRDELLGVDAPAFVDLWRGRWGEVPVTITGPAPAAFSLFAPSTPPPTRLQVAADDRRLLVHVAARQRLRPEDRVRLAFTLIRPSFPDGVLRLDVEGGGERLVARSEAGGPLREGRYALFPDGSALLTLPLSWLEGAASFVLGGSILPAGLPPERVPFRLFRPRPGHHGLTL